MKMKVMTGVFGVCLCSLIGAGQFSVAAQTPAPTGQRDGATAPATQRSASSSDAKVTVQGCLERAQSPTATPGATGTAGTASAFVLSKAEKAPAAGAAGAASPSGSAIAATYKLDADATKLTPHVGHKVEISGTIVPASSTGSTTAQSSGNATAGGAMSSMTQTLKVDEVKMLAASCTQ